MSKAKKKRKHHVRNGGSDPELHRAYALDISTHVRKMPTLKEKQARQERKYAKQLIKY